MNKKALILAIASLALLVMAGCAKKKEEAAVDPTPSKEVSPRTDVSGSSSTNPSRNAEDPLEAERRRLEDMMNRIMSEDVYFDYDKSELTDKARDLLSQVGDALNKEQRFTVLVEGHTDERGTESYNMTLGSKRSQKVVEYLKNYGVSNSRLKSVSYGEEKPKAEGESEDAYAQNRRAAFRIQIK